MWLRATFELSPELESRLKNDMQLRLGPDGKPVTKGNDYERHLFARKLAEDGKTREQTKQALLELGLDDIPVAKRERYINDVLNSILVGYSETVDDMEPVYMEGKLGNTEVN